MKTFMRCFFALLFAHSYAQGSGNHVFEIRLADYNDAPVFESVDGVLRYAGADTVEKAFFDGYTITNFYQTFPSSSVFRSLCVFTVETTSENLMTDMLTEFPSKYLDSVDLTGQTVELLTNYYPNDYGNGPYNPVPNLGAPLDLRNFDYVNAPKAWGFFTPGAIGNVAIGMSDGRINNGDADLSAKTSYVGLSGSTAFSCGSESWHATGTSAIAAAQGNNGHGMTGVCPDCSLINTYYWALPDGNYNGLLDLANAGANIINMSWALMHTNDPTYASGYNPYDQGVIDEIHDKGVILVAGAGNVSSYTGGAAAPDYIEYGYPASYNHVISVTVVNAKNANFADEVTSESYGHVSWYNQDLITPTGLYESGVYTPFWEGTTTNDRVDICGPGWHPSYGSYLLGCPNLNGNATSGSTPYVTGTAALMRSLNPCLLADEAEDVMQLSSKNIEANPYNYMYVGRLGSGKLEIGDAVEFTNEMMNATGNALVDGQDFWRFDFNLRHIYNGMTISNQIFRDHNTTFFTAKNYIDVASNDDFKPGDDGFVDLNTDSSLTVCESALKPDVRSARSENPKKVILHSVRLFPNPNAGVFDLAVDGYGAQDVSVSIYDVMGKEIFNTISGDSLIRIELPNVPSGLYFVKLSSKTLNETIKFIKQ